MKFLEELGQTLKGIGKILIQSRSVTMKAQKRARPLIVMGNGPSLNDVILAETDALRCADLMAVNFAALADVFTQLKPQYYILADPYFFSDAHDDRLQRLHDTLAGVDWEMTLLVPALLHGRIPSKVAKNLHLQVVTFNAVGVEGFKWFERTVYSKRMAMPRPRNVLIPAIMCGMTLGYTELYIVGADHSWMQSIYVDDNNHVVSVQPHFYKDDERERERVYREYEGYRLHDIVQSFYVAFRSYHRIAAYARSEGVRIINSTPGSYIDAFPRGPLPRCR